MTARREGRLGARTVFVLGLGTIVLAVVLAVAGNFLGTLLRSFADHSWITLLFLVATGAVVGVLGSRWPLPFVVLSGAVLQQGVMMVLLFTGPSGPDVDGDPAAYTTLPWNVLIQLTYAAALLIPLVLAHVALRAWRLRSTRPPAGA